MFLYWQYASGTVKSKRGLRQRHILGWTNDVGNVGFELARDHQPTYPGASAVVDASHQEVQDVTLEPQ